MLKVVVKSNQKNEHEFQLEPLPLHEPDDQGDDFQHQPLHEPDDKDHIVYDLIALIPVSVVDLQLLTQPVDQGGGDVQHDVAEHKVCVVDRS